MGCGKVEQSKVKDFMSEIIYVTEFKNQFDAWQLLHATRSKEKAHKDAGASGRVTELVRKSALDEARKEIERLQVDLQECTESHFNSNVALGNKLATANALLEWILEEMKTCRKNWCGTKGCECYVCRTIEKIEQHRGNTNG